MACMICRRTGERICDPDEADLRCMICGYCEREAADEYPRPRDIKLQEELKDGFY